MIADDSPKIFVQDHRSAPNLFTTAASLAEDFSSGCLAKIREIPQVELTSFGASGGHSVIDFLARTLDDMGTGENNFDKKGLLFHHYQSLLFFWGTKLNPFSTLASNLAVSRASVAMTLKGGKHPQTWWTYFWDFLRSQSYHSNINGYESKPYLYCTS